MLSLPTRLIAASHLDDDDDARDENFNIYQCWAQLTPKITSGKGSPSKKLCLDAGLQLNECEQTLTRGGILESGQLWWVPSDGKMFRYEDTTKCLTQKDEKAVMKNECQRSSRNESLIWMSKR